ncbi:Uu.00g040230.m01.CDS01 [Anthostomella pinea]|uniref:Uu.00g040230.m01.CDS01 n=1 Tax=Anthostomella pinea TaxID=933095 RepID=A0AAI8VA62_9PEZI|nr:Uu.00g040230.m01.CDS01 [Anthostomella pinea]
MAAQGKSATPRFADTSCMRCFRHAWNTHDWSSGEPVQVRCQFGQIGAGKCDHCRATKKSCNKPGKAMTGDWMNMAIMVNFAEFCLERTVDAAGDPVGDASGNALFNYPLAFRQKVCGLVFSLGEAFKESEKSNRAVQGGSGSPKSRTWLADRRKCLITMKPRRGPQASPQDISRWKLDVACRLLPDDEGQAPWALAVHSFKEEMYSAVVGAVGQKAADADWAAFPYLGGAGDD